MRVFDVAQRSPEWVACRLGRLTGSRAADMLTKGRAGAEAAGRRNLRTQLVLERITGKPQERQFTSAAMQHGADTEDAAYRAYEALTGNLLSRTGFIADDDLMAGCSLDGHVGDFESIIEIKCPIPATHLESLTVGRVPGDYLKQITHALWITKAQFCDWMSFEPSFPDHLQAKIIRVWAQDVDLQGYDIEARRFLSEVDAEVERVGALTNG